MDLNCPDENLCSIRTRGSSITVSAPGKVILHGEHSVVWGKLAIASSLGIRTRLCLTEIEGSDIVVVFQALHLQQRFDLLKLKQNLLSEHLPLNSLPLDYNWEMPDTVHHEALLDRVDQFLSRDLQNLDNVKINASRAFLYLLVGILGSTNVEITPFLIKMSTDLNIGAGTGSSASFLVTIAATLIQYVKLKKGPDNFSKPIYKVSNWDIDMARFNDKELEMISGWAFAAEKIFHGTPSGIDNTICTYGSLVEFRKGLKPKLCHIIRSIRIVLINTCVPRETKQLLKKVMDLHNVYPDLVNNILNAMEDVSFLSLKYIENLNKASLSIAEEQTIFQELGKLVSVNHSLLSALGVSHVRLDEAVQVLATHGLKGKLTGAGGGGYAFALIPPGFDETVLELTQTELANRGFVVRTTFLGGEGVTIDKSDGEINGI